MKKMVLIIGFVLLFFFLIISYMVNNNSKYLDNMEEKFGIDNIKYINKYDNKYVLVDDEYLYLFDYDYRNIISISADKICEKINFDIIYRNEEFQYLNDYYLDNNLIYEYYNVYNYKLIEKIVLGGL